jgi:hypothetical protein
VAGITPKQESGHMAVMGLAPVRGNSLVIKFAFQMRFSDADVGRFFQRLYHQAVAEPTNFGHTDNSVHLAAERKSDGAQVAVKVFHQFGWKQHILGEVLRNRI